MEAIQNALMKKGYKTPPYRLTLITKAVNKIIEILCDARVTLFSAEEALIILDIARDVVERGMDHGD